MPSADDDDDVRTLTFDRVVRVPPGRDGWWCDEQYAEQTGDAFLAALPASVVMADTDYACLTMGVRSVAVGNIVPDVHAVTPITGQLGLDL